MKRLLTALIVAGILSGCNSEQGAQYKQTTPETKPQIDPPVLLPEPELPELPEKPTVETPSIPLEPSIPVEPPNHRYQSSLAKA